ncbi:Vacuolar proton pump subunit E [Intoshia linei]|uniref:Vacuolar proton pump subunit E n=1 Tax=Intoshia linei TaxID=1819745 RepID=A0A177B6A9_9BILA|nr:Vacuolar proton pump subunit E [Intoshia linei]
MALSDSGVEAQIQHMIAFIDQEAKEKVEEIETKTEEEFNIEKGKLIHDQRIKLIELYDKKERQYMLKKKIMESNLVNESRLTILETKQSVLEVKCLQEAREKLRQIIKQDKDKYDNILVSLTLQCLCTLIEKDVKIKCMERDLNVLKSKVEHIIQQFHEMSLFNVQIQFVDTFLSEDCIGGLIMTSNNGLISVDNTLEKKLNQTFQAIMPSLKQNLFSTNVV